MEQDDDKKTQKHDSEHKKDETSTKIEDQQKTEHNKEADKIGKF